MAPYRPPDTPAQTTLGELVHGIRDQDGQFGLDDGHAALPVHYAGDLELLSHSCVAVIGSRRVSKNGAARARRLARELVAADIVVVSGLAAGVDAHAMVAAINAGGRVVGVIGTPLDKAYPPANAQLQEAVYRDRCCWRFRSPVVVVAACDRMNIFEERQIST